MQLFLLRHAEAEDTYPDDLRELTAKGEKTMTRLCRALNKSQFKGVKTIFHSPLVRARQTAELLQEGLELSQPLQERRGLRPEDNPLILIPDLLSADEDTLLVGHNPHLSILADALMLQQSSGGLIDFKKAGMLCLTRICEPTPASPYGEWLLSWFIIPRILDR